MAFKVLMTQEEINNFVSNNTNFYDYIYIEENGELLEFKLSFNHMDVVNAIEGVIAHTNIFDFEVISKQDLQKTGIPFHFYPRVGKFKLNGNMFSTENYFAIEKSSALDLLSKLYHEEFINSDILNEMMVQYLDAKQNNKDSLVNIYTNLFSNLVVELNNKYNLDDINTTLETLNTLNMSKAFKTSFLILKNILQTTKSNRENIHNLGLNKKFEESSKSQSEKQKIK